MSVALSQPQVLLLLPLVLLPWVRAGRDRWCYPSLRVLPLDRWSGLLTVAEKVLASLVMAAALVGALLGDLLFLPALLISKLGRVFQPTRGVPST